MTTHPTHLQFINPPGLFTPPGFTHVVEITGGRTVYIAGQIALDQSFQIVGRVIFARKRDRYVNSQYPPASTAVEVRKLALDDSLLEIEAVASLPA